MASTTVQQVKDRLSIVDVVSPYVKLDRSGSALRARCPFHGEKTPSFFVSPERGTFHCFGCGEGGDIFTFIEKIEGLDFKGALKILAEKAGVPLVYEKSGQKDGRDRLFELMETAAIFYASRLSGEAIQYLKARGAHDETIAQFRLGYAGSTWRDLSDFLKTRQYSDAEMVDAGLSKKNERGSLVDKFRNRIMFPIADSAGRVVAFSGRTFGENASPEAPKYLNSPETLLFHKSRILYGFDKAKVAMRKAGCAVLVEGQMDLLLSHQAGWGNTVAVSGTAFTDEHARLVKRMTDNLVLGLDADQAGIKAAARAARAALSVGLNVKVARLSLGLDPADTILKEGPDAWRAAIRNAKDIITFLLDVLEENSPQKDRFRRTVESAVLPFLSDVQSPIARAQYVKEIASRLDVGEAAVQETLQKLTVPALRNRPQEAAASKPPNERKNERYKHAYALLLWQESLKKPEIDTGAFRGDLGDAIGDEKLKELDALPEAEREALRFSAETLLGASTTLKRDAMEMLHLLNEERLRRLLAGAITARSHAEKIGVAADLDRLEGDVRLYTRSLAQLHKKF